MSLTGWGLLADILGVLVVALAAPGWPEIPGRPNEIHGGESWVSIRWGRDIARRTNFGGWALIVGGFGLQLVATFLR